MKLRSLIAVSALGLALAGCAQEDSTDGSAAAPSAAGSTGAACAKASLQTLTAGTFTVGTDSPAYDPWFSGDDPSNGKGLESAVAYAVAEKLGYSKDEVKWVVVPFNNVIQPGPKKFDVDVNQVSITDERKQAVDFSSGYYDVAQAIIARKDSPIANATSIADLKGAKLGGQVGTTSYQMLTDVVKPSKQPAAFDTNDIAKASLKNGQIDGLAVDLPTAFYITSAEVTDAKIVGQLPPTAGEAEQFGMVLEKGSPLTSCVTQAVDALRADGTLGRIAQEQLAQGANAPVLSE